MKEIEFLTVEDVVELHAQLVSLYGGHPGIRDQGILESSVMQAQATFSGAFVHRDLFEMASAYAFHISQNQPFVDGNKRAGLHSALVFLHINGIRILKDSELLYSAMIDIARHRLDKAGFASLLRNLRHLDPAN